MDPQDIETKQEQTFQQRLLKTYFVRFHMSLILTSVMATGVLGSRLLLHLGVHSMGLRYPIAVLISYAVFLLMVRIWIWWVSSATLAVDLSLLNNTGSSGSWSGSGGGSGTSFRFGGGSSGGGGASSSWASDEGVISNNSPMPLPLVSDGGSVGSSPGMSWFPGLPDLDLDGDDWWILLLLAVLILVMICAGGYLIYAAPQFLPEAAWQAGLAGGLHRMRSRRPDWMMCTMRSSLMPFTVVLILATVLGWQAQKHCPTASRLLEVFSCPGEFQPAPPDNITQ